MPCTHGCRAVSYTHLDVYKRQTLASNRLKPVEVVLDSEAVLAGPVEPFADVRAGIAELLLRRLDGVMKIRDSKLLMLSLIHI